MRIVPPKLLAVAGAAVTTVAMSGTADAATWSVQHPPFAVQSNVPYAPLASVSAISATNVWAVGRDDGSMLTEHWNGQQWSSVGFPSGPCDGFENGCQLTGVSGDSASDVIAVGNGVLNIQPQGWTAVPLAYRWNGSAWQPMPLPSSFTSATLQHVKAFSGTNAWAVGTGFSGSQTTATAAHWDGTSWTPVSTGFSTPLGLVLNTITGSSSSDIWVAGQAHSSGYHNRVQHSVLLHYNGTSWSQVTVPDTGGLVDVAALSATDAWAVGSDGSVLHWNGTAWTVNTKFIMGSAAIAAVSPTNVWIAGVYVNNTLSLAHFNGSAWSTQTAPTGIYTLTGGSALSSGAVWFSGSYVDSNYTTEPAILTGG
jgi:hypothetical protein